MVGLPSKKIDALVTSRTGWRFTDNGDMYKYADGSQREKFAEPDWAQPLIDGLRERTFNVLDADFKPERAELVSTVASIYEIPSTLVEAWLDGECQGSAQDQGGGREPWRRHADYHISYERKLYILRGTPSLSAGRFMAALQRAFGKVVADV